MERKLLLSEIDWYDGCPYFTNKEEVVLTLNKDVLDLFNIKEAITKVLPNVNFDIDEITYIAKDKITLTGEDLDTFNKLLTMLDEVEDVQNVYHNVDLGE